jgi:hypothetical protein
VFFNLKITDISETSNPFVIFENRPIHDDGYLFLNEKQFQLLTMDDDGIGLAEKETLNPCSIFAWLKKPTDIERRTFKIEVLYNSELVLSRYLHLGNLYPSEYSKIAL